MDLNSLQEFLPHWQLALDPAALGSSLISLAVAWGFARMFRHIQRGKRIGTLSVPVTVVRSPGWFKTLMTRWGLPERATQPLVTGLATVAFVGITYFGFDRIDLPGKPLVPAVLAVLTALNLLWLARASKGTCVGYERGLLIEGGFCPFEELRLDRQGKRKVTMNRNGWAVLFLPVLLAGCTTVPHPGGDAHWKRTGTHVVFQSLSSEDKGRDFWAWDGKPSGQPYHYLALRTTKKRGDLNHGYGIIWAFRDDANYARLLINANQQIAVHEYRDGKETTVVAWQGLAQLKTGLGYGNELRLEQLDQGIRLMVNGQDAGIVGSSYRLEGKMGCYCAVADTEDKPGDVVVEYDFDAYEFEVKDLPMGSHFEARHPLGNPAS